MKHDSTPGPDFFVLPSQTLRGSRAEMLATIDQAIVGLLALRHLIAGELPVMSGVEGSRAATPEPHRVPTPMARVGRVFSNLMSQRD